MTRIEVGDVNKQTKLTNYLITRWPVILMEEKSIVAFFKKKW